MLTVRDEIQAICDCPDDDYVHDQVQQEWKDIHLHEWKEIGIIMNWREGEAESLESFGE
jgi:hypothetical protein